MPESKMTPEEKRQERIKQLKARLQKEEALLSKAKRKERNGQLIAWGVLIEETYKNTNEEGRKRIIESAKKHLKDRNLQRALDGFTRLDEALPPVAAPQRAQPASGTEGEMWQKKQNI